MYLYPLICHWDFKSAKDDSFSALLYRSFSWSSETFRNLKDAVYSNSKILYKNFRIKKKPLDLYSKLYRRTP